LLQIELAGAKMKRQGCPDCDLPEHTPQHGKCTTRPAGNNVTMDGDVASVHIVDDDSSMRAALRRLFVSKSLAVHLYASGAEFLKQDLPDGPGCILMDVRMPGLSGLQVQTELIARGVLLPVIFLTGAADVPIAVEAMRKGAMDFIEKPFDNNHLADRVNLAIDHYRQRHLEAEERERAAAHIQRLTPREREVLELVVAGRTSKEIARELGASHRTIEIHRNHLMEKMAASTLADLIRMRLLLGASAG